MFSGSSRHERRTPDVDDVRCLPRALLGDAPDPRADPSDRAGSEGRETHPDDLGTPPLVLRIPPRGHPRGDPVSCCAPSAIPRPTECCGGATASTPLTSPEWSFPPWRRRSAGSDPRRSPEAMVRAWHRSTTPSGGRAPRCSRRRSLKPLGGDTPLIDCSELRSLGERLSWAGSASVVGARVATSSMAHMVSLGRTVASAEMCVPWPEETFFFTARFRGAWFATVEAGWSSPVHSRTSRAREGR